jgi:hypothetical protein
LCTGANEQIATLKTRLRGQLSAEARAKEELSARAAQTPAHMSTLEAILARMTARPTEKDVAEAERLQKVMAGAD